MDAATVDGVSGADRQVSRAAIAALLLGCMIGAVDGSIVGIALPSIARDLHITAAASVLIVTAYQLVTMMTIMPFAALGERIGLGRLFLGGIALFVASGACTFLAHDLPTLIVVRVFQALGAAAATSVSSALVRVVYPPRKLGRGLALAALMATAGTAIGPTIGGVVLSVARWPWLFLMLAPLGLVVLVLGRARLPNPRLTEAPFDGRGAAMCAAMFGLIVVALETFVQGGRPIVYAPLMVLAAGFSVVVVRRELGQRRPVLPVDLVRIPRLALSTAAGFAAFLSSMLINLLLPLRLQQHDHLTPVAAGALLACWAATLMVMGAVSGLLSDRVAPPVLTFAGMAVAATGMTCLAIMPAAPQHGDFVWRLILTGIGFGLFFGANGRILVAGAPIDRISAAGSLNVTLSGAGRTFGATMIAGLIASGIGMHAASSLIGAALCVVAGSCSAAQLVADRKAMR